MCSIHSFILSILHNFCYHTECNRSGIHHRYRLTCILYNCLCIFCISCLSHRQSIHQNKNHTCLKNQLSMKNKSQPDTICNYHLMCPTHTQFNILYNGSEGDRLFFKLSGNVKGISRVCNTGHFIKRICLRICRICLNYNHCKSYSLQCYSLIAILHFVRILFYYF